MFFNLFLIKLIETQYFESKVNKMKGGRAKQNNKNVKSGPNQVKSERK